MFSKQSVFDHFYRFTGFDRCRAGEATDQLFSSLAVTLTIGFEMRIGLRERFFHQLSITTEVSAFLGGVEGM